LLWEVDRGESLGARPCVGLVELYLIETVGKIFYLGAT